MANRASSMSWASRSFTATALFLSKESRRGAKRSPMIFDFSIYSSFNCARAELFIKPNVVALTIIKGRINARYTYNCILAE